MHIHTLITVLNEQQQQQNEVYMYSSKVVLLMKIYGRMNIKLN